MSKDFTKDHKITHWHALPSMEQSRAEMFLDWIHYFGDFIREASNRIQDEVSRKDETGKFNLDLNARILIEQQIPLMKTIAQNLVAASVNSEGTNRTKSDK